MIKAEFIGNGDMFDDFFVPGDVYVIEKSWCANYNNKRNYCIYVKFWKFCERCPTCHRFLPPADYDKACKQTGYRVIPYASLGAFLENWRVLYD